MTDSKCVDNYGFMPGKPFIDKNSGDKVPCTGAHAPVRVWFFWPPYNADVGVLLAGKNLPPYCGVVSFAGFLKVF